MRRRQGALLNKPAGTIEEEPSCFLKEGSTGVTRRVLFDFLLTRERSSDRAHSEEKILWHAVLSQCCGENRLVYDTPCHMTMCEEHYSVLVRALGGILVNGPTICEFMNQTMVELSSGAAYACGGHWHRDRDRRKTWYDRSAVFGSHALPRGIVFNWARKGG